MGREGWGRTQRGRVGREGRGDCLGKEGGGVDMGKEREERMEREGKEE